MLFNFSQYSSAYLPFRKAKRKKSDFYNNKTNNSKSRSNRAVEGVRSILIFIVLMHHLDVLNPSINDNSIMWNTKNKKLLAVNIWHPPKNAELSFLGILINVINGYLSVICFCIFSGYVQTIQCFREFNEMQFIQQKEHITNEMQTIVLETETEEKYHQSYPKWLSNFIQLLLKRNLKLIFPLFVIQCLAIYLYFYLSIIEVEERYQHSFEFQSFENFVQKYIFFIEMNAENIFDYKMNLFQFLFNYKGINGALWIMNVLFYSSFFILFLTLIVIQMKSFKHRMFIYAIFGMLIGNGNYVSSANEYYFPILLGVILADLHSMQEMKINNIWWIFNRSQTLLQIIFCLFLFCLLFAKQMLGDNSLAFVVPDFNRNIILRSVIWFLLIWMIIIVNHQSFVCRCVLSNSYLSGFGKYSFSLYITHIIAYRIISYAFKHNAILNAMDMQSSIYYYVFGVLFAILASVVFQKLVEKPWRNYAIKPLLNLFKNISYKI